MPTTTRTKLEFGAAEAAPRLKWRSWPVASQWRWSWLALLGLGGLGGLVWSLGGGWILSMLVVAGLAATLWQYLLPVDYEVDSLGLRRRVLNRTRLVPWHAVRAYQRRPGGIVLYRHGNPTRVDLLRSIYVPYPDDADEFLAAFRERLAHAVELPTSLYSARRDADH